MGRLSISIHIPPNTRQHEEWKNLYGNHIVFHRISSWKTAIGRWCACSTSVRQWGYSQRCVFASWYLERWTEQCSGGRKVAQGLSSTFRYPCILHPCLNRFNMETVKVFSFCELVLKWYVESNIHTWIPIFILYITCIQTTCMPKWVLVTMKQRTHYNNQ